jgi:putative two-component system response regulator
MSAGATAAIVVLSAAAGFCLAWWCLARRQPVRPPDDARDSPDSGAAETDAPAARSGPRRRSTDVPADEIDARALGEAEDRSRRALVLGLARLAEARDMATGRHLERVRRYTQELGTALIDRHPQIDASFVALVAEASVLHDIGKVGIPDHVLHQPGALSDEGREAIRRHTYIGGDALLAMRSRFGEDPFLVAACEIIFGHHEWWDGTGYPFGLEGDTIPVSARIVAVADVYDALTSNRSYRDAGPHEQARQVIVSGCGRQFDPMVVEAFLACEEQFEEIRRELGDPVA